MIPKNLYFFWHTSEYPECLERFIVTWRVRNPEFSIIRLSLANYRDYVDHIPDNFERIQIQHQSDYIRMQVLYKFGGVYADISTICFKSIHEFVDLKQDKLFGRQFVCASNSMENFFLACNPGNKAMGEWIKEYEIAIQSGFVKYCKTFRKSHPFTVLNLPYMTPYACFIKGVTSIESVHFLHHEHNYQFQIPIIVRLFARGYGLKKDRTFVKLFGGTRRVFFEEIEKSATLKPLLPYSTSNFLNDLKSHTTFKSEGKELLKRIFWGWAHFFKSS